MQAKPHPENAKRLEVLWNLDVLDSGPEQVYDDLAKLTADICETSFSMVSLVDRDRQWFKSKCGLQLDETPIEQSICSHAVAEETYLEISDTAQDIRTVDNPLCQGERAFRFYAGALLKTVDGWPLGTLCILDTKPRELSGLQRQALSVHAKHVSRQIEMTKALIDGLAFDTPNQNKLIPDDPNFIYGYEKLTPREREIHKLILNGEFGSSSKKIGRALGISPRTVDHHRANIMGKLEVDSVAELIAKSLRGL